MSTPRLSKPKNARTKRILERREPQLIEPTKVAMFLKNTTCNERVSKIMTDLALLKKPDVVQYTKKNEVLPFEDEASVAFFSQKSDAPLMCLGYNSKKRPNAICLARFFDHQLLDMIELLTTEYTEMRQLQKKLCQLGRKPLFVFQGELFEQQHVVLEKLKSLLVDFFGGNIGNDGPTAPLNFVAENEKSTTSLHSTLHLNAGIEHVVAVTAIPDSSTSALPLGAPDALPSGLSLVFRVYGIDLLKSSDAPTKVPRVELQDMGPFITWKLGRTKFAAESLQKQAFKTSKALVPKKIKNVAYNGIGDQTGRIHNPLQDFGALQSRKTKALKKSKLDSPVVVVPHV